MAGEFSSDQSKKNFVEISELMGKFSREAFIDKDTVPVLSRPMLAKIIGWKLGILKSSAETGQLPPELPLVNLVDRLYDDIRMFNTFRQTEIPAKEVVRVR